MFRFFHPQATSVQVTKSRFFFKLHFQNEDFLWLLRNRVDMIKKSLFDDVSGKCTHAHRCCVLSMTLNSNSTVLSDHTQNSASENYLHTCGFGLKLERTCSTPQALYRSGSLMFCALVLPLLFWLLAGHQTAPKLIISTSHSSAAKHCGFKVLVLFI